MSRHGFRATVFCFCSLLLTAVGVLPSYAISKDFNQTVPLQPCGTFELQNVNGPVDVQGWDRNEVEIHAVKTAKQQESDLDRVSIEVSARPDAVAVTTRCDGCIVFHTEAALKAGASKEEISEALGVAVSMNAGAALIYSARVLDAVEAKSAAARGA